MSRLENLIDDVSADRGNVTYAVNRKFRRRHMAEDFTLSYDRPLSPQACEPAILSIPFLANVLPVIWASGERYRIRSVDKEFWESIEPIKQVFIDGFRNQSWTGEVVPDELLAAPAFNEPNAPGGIFFSGGVDSTFTAQSEGAAGTTLLHVRGAGVTEKHPRRLRMLRDTVESFAAAHRMHAAFITSNLNGFLKYRYFPAGDWWSSAQHGMGIPSLGIPFAVSEGLSGLIVAGNVVFKTPKLLGSDPRIAGNLRFGGRRVRQHGGGFTRRQKVVSVVQAARAPGAFSPKLQICYVDQDDTYNCGHCLKCLVRALALIIEDAGPDDFGFEQNASEIMQIAREKIVVGMASGSLGVEAVREVQNSAAARRAEDPDWPREPDKIEFFGWLRELDLSYVETSKTLRPPMRQRIKYALRRHQGLTRAVMAVEGLLRGNRA